MRRRLWMVLLTVGLAVAAGPTARRIKRIWFHCMAVSIWNDAKADAGGGERGMPYAWLNIPTTGTEQLIIDGANEEWLSRFPCREQVGLATLVMAHRDTHFQNLKNLSLGDAVEVELRSGKKRRFEILEIYRVDKGDVEPLIQAQRKNDRLLLLTCYPFHHIGPAPKRFLAIAGPA